MTPDLWFYGGLAMPVLLFCWLIVYVTLIIRRYRAAQRLLRQERGEAREVIQMLMRHACYFAGVDEEAFADAMSSLRLKMEIYKASYR